MFKEATMKNRVLIIAILIAAMSTFFPFRVPRQSH
jgi:hypothetical protein